MVGKQVDQVSSKWPEHVIEMAHITVNQETESETMSKGRNKLQRSALKDISPLSRPNLIKLPQTPKTGSPAGEQGSRFKT